MNTRLITLVFGALFIGLIAGCGSSGSDESGSEITTNSLSHAEYIDKANAVCTKHHDQFLATLGAYARAHKSASTSERLAALRKLIKTDGIPVITDEAEEFRALGAPSGSEEKIEAIATNFEKGIEELAHDSNSNRRPPSLEKANALAAEFGFNKDCMVT